MSQKLRINKSYAENYNKWRQREELSKLKDKYADHASSSDSEESSSESEDDEAEGLTEEVERDWQKTLAALKNKDPIIYQKDVDFYHNDSRSTEEEGQKKKKKEKPVYLKDYERNLITEKGGVISDEESGEDEEAQILRKGHKGYFAEQDELRKSLLAAVKDSDEDSGDELIKTKSKRRDRQIKGSTHEWLNGQKEEETEQMQPLKNYWNSSNMDDGEKFLSDYILNKRYIDKEENDDSSDSDYGRDGFSEEEDLLVKQESFERKYNFRFEEPDADQVKTYPRELKDTVRRKDTKRAEKRRQVKERKLKEKELKKQEIKQLKNLKKQEILSKIEKLREVTGNRDLEFNEDELEKDFDPVEYDRMMQQQFDDYYDHGDVEDVKPEFEDSGDEFDEGNWDNWKGEEEEDTEYYEPHVDDPDFNMDADYDPATAPKKSKKKKKKNKLAEALETKKPIFNPDEKTFEQYLDEYYRLDYEDIIDGMPCRFKYRKTTPNDYGLSVDEILNAKEKELNSWVSLKKMSQYRSEQEEKADVYVYAKKGKNQRKKQNFFSSIYQQKSEDSSFSKPASTSELRPAELEVSADTSDHVNNTKIEDFETRVEESPKKKKKEKKQKHKKSEVNEVKDKKQTLNSSEGDNERRMWINKNTSTPVEESSKKKKEEKKHKKSEINEVKDKKQMLDSNEGDNERSKRVNENVSIPATVVTASTSHELSGQEEVKKGKKRKKKRHHEDKMKMSDERLKAYGINPKKYKYMKKEEMFRFKAKEME